MPEYRMRVYRYYPDKLYGFARDQHGAEFFFHLSVFQPGDPVEVVRCSSCPGSLRCTLDEHPPPPILGEEVMVEGDLAQSPDKGAPRASQVRRVEKPQMIMGVVESFLTQRRYGFVKGSDNVDYHLHGSEVIDGRLPLVGSRVVFFAGEREGRPRACHIKVCR